MDCYMIIGVLILGYLLGAIPVGYLVAKAARKIDLRLIGSGHTGGTNVLRAVGALPAVLTIVGDFAKGYWAAKLALMLVPDAPWVAACAGLAAVVGHVWSLFLGFKGGVGTMTTSGAAAALMPQGTAVVCALAVMVLVLKRMSSVASLTLAGLVPVACFVGAMLRLWPMSYLVFALGSSAIAVWALRENIRRLRAGTERRLGEQVTPHVGQEGR